MDAVLAVHFLHGSRPPVPSGVTIKQNYNNIKLATIICSTGIEQGNLLPALLLQFGREVQMFTVGSLLTLVPADLYLCHTPICSCLVFL